MNYNTRENCRVCQGQFEEILSLGDQHLVGFTFPTTTTQEGWQHKEEEPVFVPLQLVLCRKCKLLQLKHTTEPKLLWNENYGYRSGINQTMQQELTGIVKEIEKTIEFKEGDKVIDIGSNDGTLLSAYSNFKLMRIGYEPSRNVVGISNDVGVGNFKIYVNFFSKDPYIEDFGKAKAKVITAIAMFYDLEDPNQFLEDVKAILDPEGIFVIQQNYLVGMLDQCAFDNIVHEHLEYYSLLSLENLLARHNLEVFDVSENNINGGSFRTYIKFKGAKIYRSGGTARLIAMQRKEVKLELDQKEIYEKFALKATDNALKLGDFVKRARQERKSIYVYGASTRGNTLLQAAGLDSNQITAAAERNAFKFGRKCVGTNIPIVSEEEARKANPDYFLILPWFFKEEFVKREAEYLKNGGHLIFPLPELEII